MSTTTSPRNEAEQRWQTAELHEALRPEPDPRSLQDAIEQRLAAEADGRRGHPGRAWLLAATLLGTIGMAIAFLSAVDSREAAASRQGRELLQELRHDIGMLQQVAERVSFSFDVRRQFVTGERSTRAGEARGHAVRDFARDRIHVWFEARVLPWHDGAEPFVLERGQTVFDGRRSAVYREYSHGEQAVLAGQRNTPEVTVYESPARAQDELSEAARGAPWSEGSSYLPRAAQLLQRATENSVRTTHTQIVVTVDEPPNHHVLTFERRGNNFLLREQRHVRSGDVATTRYADYRLVDEKCWLPTRIEHESFLHGPAPDRRTHEQVTLSHLRLDARIADGTFSIVAPSGTRCWHKGPRPESKTLAGILNAEAPECFDIVYVETGDRRPPQPPTALPPAPSEAPTTTGR